MAENEQPGAPGRKKWLFAAIIFVIAIVIAVAVNYKIITRGL